MTVLDRNSGNFNTTTGVTVTRSTGNFGTGTVVVVMLFANTTFTTPSGWTQRHNSVLNLGLYSYDRTGAGETSFAFTAGAAGSGQWHSWELSAGSTYLTGDIGQNTSASATQATTTLTPTTGLRHLLASCGGTAPSSARTVTGFSNSFTNTNTNQVTAQDWPFSGRAERDVTGDGVSGFSTTATFSGTTLNNGGFVFLNYINNAGDTTPPTVPTGLTTTAIGSTTADLSWSAATDDTAVTGYELQIIGP
jgi:hypothetical protein